MKDMNRKSLLLNLAISLGTGALAAFLTRGSMEVYEGLARPPLAPPGWLFPIVWTILYILMGIAASRVSMSHSPDKAAALLLYGAQLAANFIWPLLFFRLQAYLLSFAWLVLLWFLILLTLKSFWKIDKTAGWLLVPYLAWVTFAGYLNLMLALYWLFPQIAPAFG